MKCDICRKESNNIFSYQVSLELPEKTDINCMNKKIVFQHFFLCENCDKNKRRTIVSK